MIRLPSFLRFATALGLFLGALGMVTWRQSRSFEVLGDLEEIRRQSFVAAAERIEMERTLQVLESRGRVVPLAREQLGMHTPEATELVILPGETP